MKSGKVNYHIAHSMDEAITLNQAHDGNAKYIAGKKYVTRKLF